MNKKIITLAIMVLVLNLSLIGAASAQTNEQKETKHSQKVRLGLAKLGTGSNARVEVKLKDGTKLKGYVSEATTDRFVVIDEQGVANEVPYAKAKQVKGNNLSTGAKIAIVVGIIVVVGIVLGLAQ